MTTISKLRGFLRNRVAATDNIKSVPLKALLSAYPSLFALSGNQVSLLTSAYSSAIMNPFHHSLPPPPHAQMHSHSSHTHAHTHSTHSHSHVPSHQTSSSSSASSHQHSMHFAPGGDAGGGGGGGGNNGGVRGGAGSSGNAFNNFSSHTATSSSMFLHQSQHQHQPQHQQQQQQHQYSHLIQPTPRQGDILNNGNWHFGVDMSEPSYMNPPHLHSHSHPHSSAMPPGLPFQSSS